MSKKVKLGAPEEIFDLPGNKECADCTAYGPNWASWKLRNLGILICETCAGMHRNLGTHISKVKSTTMDKWNEEQAVPCRNIGNFMSNSFYEYNLPPKTKYVTSVKSSGGDKIDTGEARKLERWIRAKYEAKKYSQPGVDPPHVRESLREAPKEEKPVEEKSASKKDKEKKEKTDKGDKSPSKKDGKEKKEKVSKKEKKDLDREVTPAPAVKEVKRSRKEKKEKKSQELESSFAELETWAMTSSKDQAMPETHS
eukprot:g17753.t1